MPLRLLALAGLLVACNGEPEPEGNKKPAPDCVDYFPDEDGDRFGDASAEPQRVCDGTPPSGYVDNGDDCDDADPDIRPGVPELCDLLGIDENCNGLIDDDDPAVVGTIDTYPDNDGDGHGAGDESDIAPACLSSSNRSRYNDDCDDNDPAVSPSAGANEPELPSGCYEDADGDGFGSMEPTNPVAAAGVDCDDAESTRFPGAIEIFGDGLDQDCDDQDLWALIDDFEDGAVDTRIWGTTSGAYTYSTVFARSGTTSVQFGNTAGNFQTIEIDTTSCAGGAGLHWSVFVKRDGGPDSGENFRIEYYDGSAWVLLERIDGGGVTDPDFIEYGGVIEDAAAFGPGVKFRIGAIGASLTSETYYVDDFSMICAGPDNDGDGFGENNDCDDTDASHWSDCGTCTDNDGDGFGSGCDLGSDCDDTDPTRLPGASDPATDGVDEDCDGLDGPPLVFDDFETGTADPAVWASVSGDGGVLNTYSWSGSFSLNMGGGGATAETVAIDSTVCSAVLWSYYGKRGPEVPDINENLVLEWWDGATWIVEDSFQGDSVTDSDFVSRVGAISDPRAISTGLKFRLMSNGSGSGTDDFFLDDFLVGCAGGDNDGDGYIGLEDCDDSDPSHWSDCGSCVDGDGDGFGNQCDLGPDCDDSAATVHPGAPDPVGDGIDGDCSGTDGAGFFDDFESGSIGALWASITGDYGYDSVYPYTGTYSLNLGGGGATAESIATDMSACPTVLWSYYGKRGPETPDAGEDLVLSWWNGTTWVEVDRQLGQGVTDSTFTLRSGAITDPLALAPGFRIRFVSNGTAVGNDDHFIDDLTVECGLGDADGDGFDAAFDCDDADPSHWSDCGICQDLDGDGFGLDCDLGADCDDLAPLIYPGAADPFGDGLDADCSGVDGPGLVDDFETGAPDPGVWASATGDFTYSTTFARSGTTSVHFGSAGATFESVDVDTSTCPSVLWRAFARRDGAPDDGDNLRFETYDGTSWVLLHEIQGGGITDSDFIEYSGALTDPTAFGPGRRMRIVATGSTLTTETYYVDDVQYVCGLGDGDGDGVDDALDCDDADPNHWSDCATCQDLDGDGYGLDCDLGPDCNDLGPAVFPGAPDPFGDGLDTNCSGLDGSGLFDDFEEGVPNAGVWASVTGDFAYSTLFSRSGTTSVQLGMGGATFDSVDVNTSSCAGTSVLWGVSVKRDGGPDTGENLRVEWFDGTSWLLLHEIVGDGTTDNDFVDYGGALTTPTAFGPGRRVRIVTTGSSIASETWFADDLQFACGLGDGDGDGVDGALDCDDGDPAHWSDCGLCVDGDGDGFGLDCDLGSDCDDVDPATYPGAPDPVGDLVDTDCTGVDGPGFFDDFELGAPDTWWASLVGDYAYTASYASSGSYSLIMGGASATAESIPMDMSPCAAIDWAYMVKRGPESPDAGDDLVLSYETATGWVPFDTLTGNGATDPAFWLRAGTITDPAALWSGFRLRIESNGAAASDDYHLDDLEIRCL